jgi:hypothetical protein
MLGVRNGRDCRDRFLCGFLDGMRAVFVAKRRKRIEDRPGREFEDVWSTCI